MPAPLEHLAQSAEWACKNTLHNLKYIPAEKQSWKPAPDANSALDIINHVAGALLGGTEALSGRPFKAPAFESATDFAGAEALLTRATQAYAAALRALPAEKLAEEVTMPWGGTMPMARVATMPATDLVHHHGQITYIQTLLGDREYHFFEFGT
jgi:uncharacterized damage-inducible protein DinB